MGRPRGTIKYDLAGKKFNKLTVLFRSTKKGPVTYWDCICDCGVKRTVSSFSLRSGELKSCGCSALTRLRHGRSHKNDPTYRCWARMKERCNNPNGGRYHRYGNRGIRVCERWNLFENFLKDMGEKPKGLSIERIDNNKGYCKENCKWATPKEQANNKNLRTTPCKTRKYRLPVGVYPTKRGSYASSIQIDCEVYYCGTFPTVREATVARGRMIQKHSKRLSFDE